MLHTGPKLLPNPNRKSNVLPAFHFTFYTPEFLFQICKTYVNIPVLRIYNGDNRNMRHCYFPVFADAFQCIAKSREHDSFQHIIGALHTVFNIGSHNGTAETLKIFIRSLQIRWSSPHSYRQHPRSVYDFLRRINRKTSDRLFLCLPNRFSDCFVWRKRRAFQFFITSL